MIKKVSLLNIPQWYAWSGILKNLIHKANSKNPSTTFTELSHPPDWGKLSSQLGKTANNENGTANAIEKPNITIIGLIPLLYWACLKGDNDNNRFGNNPLVENWKKHSAY